MEMTSTRASPSSKVQTELPHLTEYLSSLAQGIDSFPDCETTVSLCKMLRRDFPSVFAHPGVPEALRGRLCADWPDDVFIPVSLQVAIMLLLVDVLGLSRQELADLICEKTKTLFESPTYRIFFRLVSPALVVMGGTTRWNRDFRGMPLRVKLTQANSAQGELSYPPGLAPPLYLAGLSGIFRAALEKSRGNGVSCRIEEHAPGQAGFWLAWGAAQTAES